MVSHVWSKPRDTHAERAGAADQTEVRASAPGHCTSGARPRACIRGFDTPETLPEASTFRCRDGLGGVRPPSPRRRPGRWPAASTNRPSERRLRYEDPSESPWPASGGTQRCRGGRRSAPRRWRPTGSRQDEALQLLELAVHVVDPPSTGPAAHSENRGRSGPPRRRGSPHREQGALDLLEWPAAPGSARSAAGRAAVELVEGAVGLIRGWSWRPDHRSAARSAAVPGLVQIHLPSYRAPTPRAVAASACGMCSRIGTLPRTLPRRPRAGRIRTTRPAAEPAPD
jgi:hypothetical protein